MRQKFDRNLPPYHTQGASVTRMAALLAKAHKPVYNMHPAMPEFMLKDFERFKKEAKAEAAAEARCLLSSVLFFVRVATETAANMRRRVVLEGRVV